MKRSFRAATAAACTLFLVTSLTVSAGALTPSDETSKNTEESAVPVDGTDPGEDILDEAPQSGSSPELVAEENDPSATELPDAEVPSEPSTEVPDEVPGPSDAEPGPVTAQGMEDVSVGAAGSSGASKKQAKKVTPPAKKAVAAVGFGPKNVPVGTYTGKLQGVVRLGGGDRFATNVSIAKGVKAKASSKTRAVFVASAKDFADGLSLGALAQAAGWPLFLVDKNSVPTSVLTQIKAVKPTHVYIAGGKNSISAKVEKIIAKTGQKAQVTRFAGANRFETSKKIAAFFPQGSPAFLVSGETFADAVVAAGPAAKENGPIILTGSGWLRAEASDAIRAVAPKRLDVIGATWSAQNLKNVRSAARGKTVNHIAGKDRYDTSAKVAARYFGKGSAAVYTNGGTFPDALSGISAAAVVDGPVILTQQNCRPASVASVSDKFKNTRVLLGGGSSVTAASYKTTCATVRPLGQQIATRAETEAAKTLVGLHCSDFVRKIYSEVGHPIPDEIRSSYSMSARGKQIPANQAQPGDIAVMQSAAGGHVAIFLGYRGGEPWLAESLGIGSHTSVGPAWGTIYKFVRF